MFNDPAIVQVQQHQAEELPSGDRLGPHPTVLTLESSRFIENSSPSATMNNHQNINSHDENCVTVTPEPAEQALQYHDQDGYNDDDKKSSYYGCFGSHWKTRQGRGLVLLGCFMVVSVLVLVLTLVISENSDSNGLDAAEQIKLNYFRERYVVLRTALSNYSKPYLFYNPDSAQSKALQWLVFKDETLDLEEVKQKVQQQNTSNSIFFRLAQRYAYLILYFDCGGTDWFSLEESGSKMDEVVVSVNECSFLGCYCNDQGQVTHLTLNTENLVGAIPQELGVFTNLQELDLGANDLRGTIPLKTMKRLTNLESLILDFNGLWGPISSEIGQLTKLRTFRVGTNRLTGTLPGESLSKLVQMEHFDIKSNSGLSGPLLDIATAGPWSRIIKIDAYKTAIGGTIPDDISPFSKLEYLGLGDTQMSGRFPDSLTKISTLKTLLIGSQLFRNATFPPDIGNLRLLEDVAFFGRGIQGVLPTELGLLTNMKYFVASGNAMEGTVPSEIGLLSDLRALDLSDNNFHGTIPEELGNLNRIEVIKLRGTLLTGTLPPDLCVAPRLNVLFYPCELDCGTCCQFGCDELRSDELRNKGQNP